MTHATGFWLQGAIFYNVSSSLVLLRQSTIGRYASLLKDFTSVVRFLPRRSQFGHKAREFVNALAGVFFNTPSLKFILWSSQVHPPSLTCSPLMSHLLILCHIFPSTCHLAMPRLNYIAIWTRGTIEKINSNLVHLFLVSCEWVPFYTLFFTHSVSLGSASWNPDGRHAVTAVRSTGLVLLRRCESCWCRYGDVAQSITELLLHLLYWVRPGIRGSSGRDAR